MSRNAVVNILVVAAAVCVGVAWSAKPWQVAAEQQEAADAQVREMQESERTTEELLRRAAVEQGSIAREEQARKRGLLPKGEKQADLQ